MKDAQEWFKIHQKGIAAAGAAAVALVLGLGLGRRLLPEKTQTAAAQEKVYPVRVIETKPSGGDITLKYTGLVQPQEIIQCMPQTISTIEELYVKEGDFVRQGQPIARLDVSKAQQQAANTADMAAGAKSSLDAAQSARDRAQRDYDAACQKAPEEELNAARSQRDEAQKLRDEKQAEVERIQKALEPYQARVDQAKAACDVLQAATQEKQAAADQAAQVYEEKEAARKALEDAGDTSSPEYQAAQAAAQQAKTAKEEAETVLAAAKTEEKAGQAALTQAQGELDGQKVTLGQPAAEAALAAAQAQLDVRQAAVTRLEAQGENSQTAQVQRQRLEAAEAALTQAHSFYNSAQRSSDSAQQTASQDKLLASASGHIVKLVGTEGGLASPLAPVAVIASQQANIQFGASQEDVRQLYEGMPATITLDGIEYTGQVTSIALLPDEATRTYPVSVSVQGAQDLFLGSMACVKLSLGQRNGIWLPLHVILNDGQDYVYIVQEGHALRRDVDIAEISGDRVLVNGLESGCQIISEGMKTVRSGSAVSVAEQTEERGKDGAA